MMKSSMLGSSSYVLTQLDVYDWGAFGGRHQAPIDLSGTAIIGPTGSGKTTLVDALMTLLVESPRYNLASTGGHESDRDLMSYVRGVSGAGNASEENAHIARAGPVVSGIAARFDTDQATLRIGGLFWFEGTSSALVDLKRRWFFCEAETPDFDEWLETHRVGGARALKELERRSAGLTIYDTKKAYLARLRTHFEVGENAFALLNRAAGLKQLNSIDSVFRELVLDDRSGFESARAVAGEFDTLAAIRQELETAKRQRDSLIPIASGWEDLEKVRADLAEQGVLKMLLPVWFAEEAHRRWHAQLGDLTAQVEGFALAEADLAGRILVAERSETIAHAAYLDAGGGDIERLQEQIGTQGALAAARERTARDYQAKAHALGMDTALTNVAVARNHALVEEVRAEKKEALTKAQQTAWDRGVARSALDGREKQITQELVEVRTRPGSNVPTKHQDMRRDLATHLRLHEEDVPFVAELIEVKIDEKRWRGAIERAIGGERLRLLIPPERISEALAWINSRDTGLLVRAHEAHEAGAPAQFFSDGFCRKLNFKSHALREPLKRLLAQIDRHCVDRADLLRTTPHAMTVEGLMSGRKNFFDKDDRIALDKGWVTGFNNRDQISELELTLSHLRSELGTALTEERLAQSQADSIRKSMGLLDAIASTVFEDIDLPSAQAELERLNGQMQRLTAPRSDAAFAKAQWQSAHEVVKALRDEEITLRADLKDHQRQADAAANKVERLSQRIGPGLAADQTELASAHFEPIEDVLLEDLDDTERRRSVAIQSRIDGLTSRGGTLEKRLIAQMKDAKQIDTGALTDVRSDLDDVPDFLERLRILQEEALPEKTTRFIAYLNQSSDQGVTQLLSEIDTEVSAIEERISALNATLRRVDFQPERYLHLDPQRVVHESLQTLHKARAQLRAAQMKEDQGESHYAALAHVVALLRDAVDRRKTQGALALLDPRYRLQFAVLVIDRETGKIIERRTSSQGGSGGEKEIIASYVLTASLSYALCPDGSQRPLFGTIVLDEAFSKSSHAVAGRIIRALTEFGLHPLFVTPNKELRLLREHTRSAIVVHRRGNQATTTSLSWDALEAHAKRRRTASEHVDEVA